MNFSDKNHMVEKRLTKNPALLLFSLLSAAMLVSAFMLVRDAYRLISDGVQPSCDINPFFSCGNIFSTWQASVFLSTPNPVYGLIGYTVMLTVFVSMIQGGTFKPWFLKVFTVGMVTAWLFLMWLFYQSTFMIGFLCLYCMVVWVLHTILLFFFIPWVLKNDMLQLGDKMVTVGEKLFPYMWLPMLLTFSVMFISVRIQFPLLFPF